MIDLVLGPDVIERLIPHRRPLLMIDRVVAYERAPRPTLKTQRHVSANEPVFEGHFPGLHLWPGVYTIEGFGQSCTLLACVLAIDAQRGDEGLRALMNLERGFRFDPGYDAELGRAALDGLRDPIARAGMSAAVDVKLLRPVFAGERVDFTVTLARSLGELVRFDVSAEVDGKEVARGAMTSTTNIPIAPR